MAGCLTDTPLDDYAPVPNVIKLFTVVSYDFSYQARVFVPGKPFQPSLMFGG
jgi:hypothetical protein